MLYLPDSLVIFSPLLELISTVALSQRGGTVGRRKWIKNPHIKKRALPIISPKILCHNVKVGSILSFSCSVA